jgi:hypothetical protein
MTELTVLLISGGGATAVIVALVLFLRHGV